MKKTDMMTAWQAAQNDILAEYPDIDVEALKLLQKTYYKGALAGTVVSHQHLSDQALGYDTREKLLTGLSVFAYGLNKSVRKLETATQPSRDAFEVPADTNIH